jgi:hypothetical protein
MLAMAGKTKGEVVVPPTLQALLAARLDQLEPPERIVLERGRSKGRSSTGEPSRRSGRTSPR